jgi:hypothetical protein
MILNEWWGGIIAIICLFWMTGISLTILRIDSKTGELYVDNPFSALWRWIKR